MTKRAVAGSTRTRRRLVRSLLGALCLGLVLLGGVGTGGLGIGGLGTAEAEPAPRAPAPDATAPARSADDSADDDSADDDSADDDSASEGDDAAPPAPNDSDDDAEKVKIVQLAPSRHVDIKARSVRLTEPSAALLLRVAARFHGATGKPLVVTGGERSPRRQAELMYKKLQNGEDLVRLYARTDLVRPVVRAFTEGKEAKRTRAAILRTMTALITAQVAQKQYLSQHLAFTAADVRSRDMSEDEVGALLAAIKAEPGARLVDERQSATPCFHLGFHGGAHRSE
jgi:hypothetical protein